jgi:MraZ protein
MFLGEYHRSKDIKGRIIIPSKFREELIGGIIIAKGFNERCLFLFSKDSWKNLQDRIMSGPVTKKNILVFSRWFFSSATEEVIDQQGRVKVPQNLIDYAGLDKDIVMVGVSDRVEIWSKELWSEYYNNAEKKFMEDSGTFEELGF